jgi:integrase
MTTTMQRFEREYQEYEGISEGRRREQVKAIEAMGRLAGKAPEECDDQDVRKYLADLGDQGRHVNTIRKELNMIKPFFSWGWQARVMTAEQVLAVQQVGAPRKSTANSTPRPYTKKDLMRFWADFDLAWPKVDPKFWARWKRGTSPFRRIRTEAMRVQIEAIVALALHCGLRRQEIYRAGLDDIHYDNAFIVVRHAKGDNDGDKVREVPHTESSRAAVKAWIELRTILGPTNDSVWLSLANERDALKPMRYTRFKGLMRTIGDPPPNEPGEWQLHRFRHTAGTEWLRSTRRLEIVQKLLGHATLQQTLGYAKLVRDDLHEAIAKSELEFEEAVGAR